jgi:DNA-binding beta-propeller fold protein YncE
MRCRVTVTTNDPSVRTDLRLNWKRADSSIAASPKEVGPAGEASLAVADDKHEGDTATVVVLDAAGNVLDRKPTTVGETP